MIAPETKEEELARFRAEGRSEQEIAYFQAENQKDYDPILKDPNTPTKVITDIVDRITLVPLKILALKHPNINERSILYILEKADKKAYQKDLIEAYIETNKLNEGMWIKIKKFYNVAKRTEKIIIELLKNNINVDIDMLNLFLNTLTDDDDLKFIWVDVIFKHKNFKPEIVEGDFFRRYRNFAFNDVLKSAKESKFENEIRLIFFKMTNDTWFLPKTATEIFIF